jgi:hypothetical protein
LRSSMKTYVKVFGPPLLRAIRALERLSIGMPQVAIMDTLITLSTPNLGDERAAAEYLSSLGAVSVERSRNIISRSGEELGEYDFFFEWLRGPSVEQFHELIDRIDEALAPLGCWYKVTTKPR